MNCGLSINTKFQIKEILSTVDEVESADIFGSRSLGNYKNGSDIDLVLYGAKLTEEIRLRISTQLNEELPLPYYFDIVVYSLIQNQALKDHIDQYGVEIYTSSLNVNGKKTRQR